MIAPNGNGKGGLTLHLLSENHIPPPSKTDGLVKQHSRPGSIRCDDFVVLLCLIRNGRNAGGRNVGTNLASLGVGDIVDRGEEAGNRSHDRVTRADPLSVVIYAAVLSQLGLPETSCISLNPPDNINVVERELQHLPRLMAREPIS
jgi:hypothetical protein